MKKPQEKRKKSKVAKIVTLFASFVVLLILALIIAAYSYITSKFDRANVVQRQDSADTISDEIVPTDADASTAIPEIQQKSGVINIMLIGVDNDYLPGMSDRGNADGLILVSINSDTKQIVMTSIMRDIFIQIPNQYKTKITLVYHDQGTDALLNTIEDNFDIEIDNYVMVNYLNVIDIVDALGGLELEVTAAEIAGMQGKIDNLNSLTGDPYGTDMLTAEDAGMQLLNGKQVAALLRIRNTGNNDFGRTARARTILTAMKDRAMDMSLSELNNLANVVMENITTDMDTTEMMKLLLKAPTYMGYEFVSNRIPIEGSYTTDKSYVYLDYDVNKEALHNVVYKDNQ